MEGLYLGDSYADCVLGGEKKKSPQAVLHSKAIPPLFPAVADNYITMAGNLISYQEISLASPFP